MSTQPHDIWNAPPGIWSIQTFIEKIPKVELHLHIEGSLEPELMFTLAERNNIKIPYSSVEDVRAAYQFTDLQSFLDVYYLGMSVLLHEQDFYDLTMAYFTKVAAENVKHVELFFDPQGHTARGVKFDVVINGISKAMKMAETTLGVTSYLIMSFLRHLSEEDAFATLAESVPHRDKIIGVGLDSSEVGNPPEKFQRVFAEAKKLGMRLVAHAGEEGPPEYIFQALDLLTVERIDHGVRSIENDDLIARLVENKVCLTVCPLSNEKLKVFPQMKDHPMKRILDRGICANINSDDPAYFGGYMNANYLSASRALGMTPKHLVLLTHHAIEGCFLPREGKDKLIALLTDFLTKQRLVPQSDVLEGLN